MTCCHCNSYSPALLALRCMCGETDHVCSGCLRLMADSMDEGEEIPSGHIHNPQPQPIVKH